MPAKQAGHRSEARPRRRAAKRIERAVEAAELTILFCWPKLSAKAPMTALIAPLAPIIGTARPGSTSHCAIAAA